MSYHPSINNPYSHLGLGLGYGAVEPWEAEEDLEEIRRLVRGTDTGDEYAPSGSGSDEEWEIGNHLPPDISCQAVAQVRFSQRKLRAAPKLECSIPSEERVLPGASSSIFKESPVRKRVSTHWSDREVQQLKRLVAQGTPIARVAELMNRSLDSVNAKKRRVT